MRKEICRLGETVYLKVDYLPRHELPSLIGGEIAYLPEQYVLMDETLREPIYVSPDNPNLIWDDTDEMIAEWVWAAIKAYGDIWEKQLLARKEAKWERNSFTDQGES